MANTNVDQLVGLGLFSFSLFVFVYYTLWVIVTPFVDDGHFIQKYFLPREYAIIIPAVLLVLLVVGIVTFLAMVMIKSGKTTKAASKKSN